MKKILCGKEKGYLIPKRIVDDKLRKKFEVLKNQQIIALGHGYKTCWIEYKPQPKIEKKKDYIIKYSKTQGMRETLVFKKELLNELFGLKENITDIELKVVKNKTAINSYRLFLEEEEYLFDDKDIYYFFGTTDYETEDICEMS